jgi:hypothetical protein
MATEKKTPSKRELIEPTKGDKRYVRRKADGTFGKTVPKKSWSDRSPLENRESLVNESVRESLPVVPRKNFLTLRLVVTTELHFGPLKEPLIVSHPN